MVDSTAPSTLAGDAGVREAHVADAFALLGNETRVSILLALWAAYDPHAADNAVAFSEIFEHVDRDDRGNVSYHLDELQGQFVTQRTERGGYELREPGLQLVRTILAGAGIQDVEREPREIDQQCPFCDGATTVSYRDGVVLHTCTACAGVGSAETAVDGFLSAVPFDPAGLAERSVDEIYAAATVAAFREIESLYDGVCPTCSGRVEGWMEACPDHEPTGTCSRCERQFSAWACFRCRVCKNHSTNSPKTLALFHPAVVSFYDDHGLSTRIHADDPARVRRVSDHMDAHEMSLLDDDPPRVRVTASRDGDAVSLTFDETVTIVDVAR